VKGCKCALCRAVRSESVQRYRSQA
jgi:hypothetical protein